MYRRILIPLEGSSFAEQALPLALSIARRADARLDLVEVHTLYALDEAHAGWEPFDANRDAECRRQEQLYLDATAKWVTSVSSVSTTAGVLAGSAVFPATVADSVLERARSSEADLIVMTSHGRGPLGRFGIGSMADELVRRASIPVLVVPPLARAPGLFSEPVLENVLILLDGSALAEQVLEPAVDLARLMEAPCRLLRVVPSRSFPGSRRPGSFPDTAPAEAYLERVAGRLQDQGLPVRKQVVIARHAAEAIVKQTETQPGTVVALATHGRHGLRRLLRGSVADKLIQAAVSPVLVYHPTGKEC